LFLAGHGAQHSQVALLLADTQEPDHAACSILPRHLALGRPWTWTLHLVFSNATGSSIEHSHLQQPAAAASWCPSLETGAVSGRQDSRTTGTDSRVLEGRLGRSAVANARFYMEHVLDMNPGHGKLLMEPDMVLNVECAHTFNNTSSNQQKFSILRQTVHLSSTLFSLAEACQEDVLAQRSPSQYPMSQWQLLPAAGAGAAVAYPSTQGTAAPALTRL